MKTNSKSIAAYRQLRDEIDKLSAKLEKEHTKYLSCKSGCDLCCMDYSIFPVEFYSILEELKNQKFQKAPPGNRKNGQACVFLKNHQCTIYNSRPIICRTHGLPLLFTNNEAEWELSACELNFKEFDLEKFTSENTFPQDKFNSKLFQLNKKFITEFDQIKHGEFDLIPIKNLAKKL